MPPSPLQAEVESNVSLKQVTHSALVWFRRNFLWLVAGSGFGALVALGIFYVEPRVYSLQMIGYANNLNDVRLKEITSDLNMIRSTGQYDRLAKVLNLPLPVATSIRGITVQWHEQLETELPSYPPRPATTRFFGLTVETLAPEHSAEIQYAIVTYFDSLPFVKNIMEGRRFSSRFQIETCLKEIDYLKEIEKIQLGMNTPNAYIGDPGAASVHMLELAQRLGEESEELSKLKHETVILKDMTQINKPMGAGPYRSALQGGIYGLIATALFFVLSGAFRMSRQA